MISNIFMYLLRTRTRNARTRANANVMQALRLVATAVAGRTMQNRCRTYLPAVSFCGIAYAYHKSLFSNQFYKTSDAKVL